MTAEIEQPQSLDAAPAGLIATEIDPTTRVWRCARSTIALVGLLMLVIGIVVPAAALISFLAGITAFGGQQVLVLSVLGAAALVSLYFGWRLALHPRLIADRGRLLIINPFKKYRFDLAEVTLLTPGGDGLVIGTLDAEAEAWCVQKPMSSIKSGRRTRADQICDELTEIRDRYHRPIAEPDGVMIRFARLGDEDVLTELERSASLARLAHVFPPEEFPYPDEDVRKRWHAVLSDRTMQTMLAEADGHPVGYAAVGNGSLLHLGVADTFQRRGLGSVLLEAAEDELFADPVIPQISLWVLRDNGVARAFYEDRGWFETEAEREAEFPPYPVEVRMVRKNPHLARRSR